VEVSEKESYSASLRLIRSGLLVGPSAGFAYKGALRHLERLEETGALETLRGTHVVFICPDTPFPYAEDYERVLGTEAFPLIENAHLRGHTTNTHLPAITAVPEISPEEVFTMYTSATEPNEMKASGVTLIDVREPNEFEDHHLPDSENIPLASLSAWLKKWPDSDTSRVVFICRSGNRSARATHLARLMGLDAYNLSGGTVEWSAREYPRVRFYCPPSA